MFLLTYLSMISVKTKRMQGDTGGRINQRKMVIFEQPSLDWSHRKREVKLSRVILNICVYIFGKVNACTYALSCFQYFYTGERNINTHMQTKHAHTTCGHFYMYLLHVHTPCTHGLWLTRRNRILCFILKEWLWGILLCVYYDFINYTHLFSSTEYGKLLAELPKALKIKIALLW